MRLLLHFTPLRWKLTCLTLLIAASHLLNAQTGPTAVEIASQMTIGWNHGNSLEVPGDETAWGNAPASQQLIDGVAAAGFNTVRLPCAWDSYANQSTYEISPTWLARVKEVVDYCYANNLFVVLNSHWDGGWLEEHPFYANQQEVNAKQQAYWTQVANYFASYDEHLLFAGTNEVRADYGDPTAEYIEVQESYNQTFVDAVRASGGNNLNRILIVQTYNTNAWHGLNYFSEPNDPVSDRMFVEIHHYDSYDFTLNPNNSACPQWDSGSCSWAGTSYVEDLFNQVSQRWVANGIPVIIGEYGAIKRDAQHEPERLEYLEYTTDAAKRHGLIPIYWDNGYDAEFALFERSTGNIIDQGTVDALMSGAGVGNPGSEYNLSITTSGSGKVTTNPTGSVHQQGTVVNLTATADAGWEFVGWSGDLNGSNNPTSITMNSHMNITATFVQEGTGGTGSILREYWTNISGTGITALTGHSNYPNSPSGSEQLTSLDGPVNWADNYGTRIRGYIHPPVTGSYTLWVAGDDNTDLYLSTDESPGNASRIANISGWTNHLEWNKYNTQQATVNLTAGQKYYIEVLHKEGSGGDNVSVAWQGPGIAQAIIAGNYLSPFAGGGSTTQYSLTTGSIGSGTIDLSPSGGTYDEGTTVTLTAIPDQGWQFDGWSGDLSGTTNPVNLLMNSNKNVTALFSMTTSQQFTVSTTANGSGSIILNPSGGVYAEGTVVSITAQPATGWQFDSWSGDVSGTSNPVSITVDSDKNVTATFTETTTGNPCDNPTSVTLPFSYDGAGEFCWQISGNVGYVNSWNTDFVEINGVDYSNSWSNSLPPKIQGKYYVHYSGSVAWAHFEASKSNAREGITADLNEIVSQETWIYPNPFQDTFSMNLPADTEIIQIEIMDITGRTVVQLSDLKNMNALGESLNPGQYILNVSTSRGSYTFEIVKQ